MTKTMLMDRLEKEKDHLIKLPLNYNVVNKEALYSKYTELFCCYIDSIAKTDYDIKFYESAFCGLKAVIEDSIDTDLEPFPLENGVGDIGNDDNVSTDTLKKIIKDTGITLNINAMLTSLQVKLFLIRFRVFNLDEQWEHFSQRLSELTEEELDMLLTIAPGDEIIFEIGCSINNAKDFEMLTGREYKLFDDILRNTAIED